MNISPISNILSSVSSATTTALNYAKVHKASSSLFATAGLTLGYAQYLNHRYTKAHDLIKNKIPAATGRLKSIKTILADKFGLKKEQEIPTGTLEEIRDFLKDERNFKGLSQKLTPEVLKARQGALEIVEKDIESFNIDQINEMMNGNVQAMIDLLENVKTQEESDRNDCVNTAVNFLKKLLTNASSVADLKEKFDTLKTIVDKTYDKKFENRKNLCQALTTLRNTLGNNYSFEQAFPDLDQCDELIQNAYDFNTKLTIKKEEEINRKMLLKPLIKEVVTSFENLSTTVSEKVCTFYSKKDNSYFGNVKNIRCAAALIFAGGVFALTASYVPAIRNTFIIKQIG